MRNTAIILGASALLIAGCGSEDPAEPNPTGTGMRDVRVEIPEPIEGVIDLISPEFVIPAGEERLYCMYLENDAADIAVTHMDALQGEGGHHVVLLTTTRPRPAGTVTDCSKAEDMRGVDPFVLPDIELPAGDALFLPAGMQYVYQVHYVNPFPEDLLIRDVARIHTTEVESVQTWVAGFVTNSLELELPASTGPATLTFDCVADEATELLLVGGHLHEQGSMFEVEVGPNVDELKSIYLVDPWRPDYRDAPPVSLFFENPMPVPAGTIIRTTCVWDNETGEEMRFPEEMCSSFGYGRGLKRPYVCSDGVVGHE